MKILMGMMGITIMCAIIVGCSVTGTSKANNTANYAKDPIKIEQTTQLHRQADQLELITINTMSMADSLRRIAENTERIADILNSSTNSVSSF